MNASKRDRLPRTVRFWVWWNDGLTRIAVRRDKPVVFGYSERDEEGYSYRRLAFSMEDDGVYLDSASGGRDCDGRVDDVWSGHVSFDHLASLPPVACIQPTFVEESSMINDHSAQAANY